MPERCLDAGPYTVRRAPAILAGLPIDRTKRSCDVDDDSLFSETVLRFFDELKKRNVRFMVVGMSGAHLQGIHGIPTMDVDIWVEGLGSPAFCEAALAVGGFYRPPTGYDLQPPRLVGVGLDALDLVLSMSGLGAFAEEYAHVVWISQGDTQIPLLPSGAHVPVLALERITKSKEAAARSKDVEIIHLLREQAKELGCSG